MLYQLADKILESKKILVFELGIEIKITKVETKKNVDDDFFSELLKDGKFSDLINDIGTDR